jgi:hypothetical protein
LLHFVPEEEDPAGIAARFAAALAPGSLIAISHLTGDFASQAISDKAKACNARGPVQVYPRSREQVTGLCGSLCIEYPGVVPVNHWMPSLRETLGPALDLHAAVIRLPRPDAGPGSSAGRTRFGVLGAVGEAAALERAAARYPGHRILRENTGAGVAYVAQARDLRTRPYVVMASSLEQLCARLDAAS